MARNHDLVARLRNVHDGEQAIVDIIRLGDLAVPDLESLLQGPSQVIPHPRCWAADALAGIGSPSAIRALLRSLREISARVLPPQIQEAESVVIGRIAEHLSIVPGADISEALLDTLRAHPSSPSCVRAAGRRLDPRALCLLADCLFEDGSRGAAAEALAGFGLDAVPYLIEALGASMEAGISEAPTHVQGRQAAAEVLGACLNDRARADSDHLAAAAAALVTALHDPERAVRLAAAIALSRLDCADRSAVAEVLVSALQDVTWRQLDPVTNAIQRLGDAAIGPLSEAIRVPAIPGPQQVRAVVLAGRLDAAGMAPLVAALVNTADVKLRVEAARALGRMSALRPDLLARFLGDPVPLVRRIAFVALWRHRSLSIETTLEFLADPDRHIRRIARFVLRRQGSTALPLLIRAIQSAGKPAHGLPSRWRLWQHACALSIEIFCSRPAPPP